MRKMLVVVALVGALLAGCASMGSINTDSLITTLSTDAGYAVARIYPESRPIFAAVCLLTSSNLPADQLGPALKELIGQMWTGSSAITSTDAQFAVLALNNLVGIIGLQDDVTVETGKLKLAASGLCAGAQLVWGK